MSDPRIRAIEGCGHQLDRMTEWADNGACPICLTAENARLREALVQIQRVNSSLRHDESISFIWLRDLCDKALNPQSSQDTAQQDAEAHGFDRETYEDIMDSGERAMRQGPAEGGS
jgi:hypothetical protein